ncbi:MAG: UDP-N-acetylmuramoylalanine--D-glutamate ligase [candidate division Zixibacteria bacterium RBG_16_50_21]|nr:MAG: UDP-N-acetylmuramoylalanine--D-glutamate ligase [candidate division Zixibacteria bacterium RBG_16_50_21]
MPKKRLDRITGKKVAILGMARSGLALAKLLKSYGARVFLSDTKPEHLLFKEIEELKKIGADWEAGGHTPNVWQDRDFLVVSPGVPDNVPILKKAEGNSLPIFSEIEVASWLCQGRIIGITGSNGKTTTTTLVGQIFHKAGLEVAVGGNVGNAFSNIADTLTENGWAVLELSSFQLERVSDFKPHVAAILNLSPDHLDRYPDYNAYVRAKLRIFENQDSDDFAVLNADDQETEKIKKQVNSNVILSSSQKIISKGSYVKEGWLWTNLSGKEKKIIPATEIGIRGPHNLANSAAASAIAGLAGIESDVIASVLREFNGVEHRLEEVATVTGIRFVNDSKATNVDSVWYALQSVSRPIILIAGGKDKGSSYLPLADLVRQNVKLLILIGQAAGKIRKELGNLVPTQDATSLEEAIEIGFKNAAAGDTVLLSPACASFDMFENYEHRGKVFKQSVKKLQEQYGK